MINCVNDLTPYANISNLDHSPVFKTTKYTEENKTLRLWMKQSFTRKDTESVDFSTLE